ncbi:MAG: hypothetical protein AB7O86_05900 [Porticoccaceae bacterium]
MKAIIVLFTDRSETTIQVQHVGSISDDDFYDALVTGVRRAGHDPDEIDDFWPA